MHIFDLLNDPRLRRLSFEYPGSAGAGPRHFILISILLVTQVIYVYYYSFGKSALFNF